MLLTRKDIEILNLNKRERQLKAHCLKVMRSAVVDRNRTPKNYCSDFSTERNQCILCAAVMKQCQTARLVRCNWVPKKINIKLAQQNLF